MVVNRLPPVLADCEGCVQDSSGCTAASAVAEKAHHGVAVSVASAALG